MSQLKQIHQENLNFKEHKSSSSESTSLSGTTSTIDIDVKIQKGIQVAFATLTSSNATCGWDQTNTPPIPIYPRTSSSHGAYTNQYYMDDHRKPAAYSSLLDTLLGSDVSHNTCNSDSSNCSTSKYSNELKRRSK